jgi:ferritin-like protein
MFQRTLGTTEATADFDHEKQKIIKVCDGTDCVTQDLAVEILADEEVHRCLFAGFLKSPGKR